jgi:hypothetical protein
LTSAAADVITPAIAVENTVEVGSQADAETQPPVVPAPLLSVAVLGIIYGSLLAAWLVGEAAGSMAFLVPALGPPMNAVPLSVAAWRVIVAAAGLVVAGVLVTASAGCFRLKRWARPLMVSYAVVDLALQVLVLLTVFAWVGPATLNAAAARNAGVPAGDPTSQELWMYVAWLVRWVALSLFPAAVLAVMTRRQVREAFGPGARAGGFAVETAPTPQADPSGAAG